jgi:hypothetical protein
MITVVGLCARYTDVGRGFALAPLACARCQAKSCFHIAEES